MLTVFRLLPRGGREREKSVLEKANFEALRHLALTRTRSVLGLCWSFWTQILETALALGKEEKKGKFGLLGK